MDTFSWQLSEEFCITYVENVLAVGHILYKLLCNHKDVINKLKTAYFSCVYFLGVFLYCGVS